MRHVSLFVLAALLALTTPAQTPFTFGSWASTTPVTVPEAPKPVEVKAPSGFDKALYTFTDRSGKVDSFLNATVRDVKDLSEFFAGFGIAVKNVAIEKVAWKQAMPSAENPTRIPLDKAAEYGFGVGDPLYITGTIGSGPLACGTTFGVLMRGFKRDPVGLARSVWAECVGGETWF